MGGLRQWTSQKQAQKAQQERKAGLAWVFLPVTLARCRTFPARGKAKKVSCWSVHAVAYW